MNTSRDLTVRLAQLLRREHAALAEFLLALAEFDRERRWLELGHTSLFYFLHRELGLSKGAAFYRKTAAELVQRYPEVIDPLRDGRLCVTSVVQLAKVITPENRSAVLPRFFHRSKREAEELAAELRPVPVPPRREVVTAVGASRAGDAGGERGALIGGEGVGVVAGPVGSIAGAASVAGCVAVGVDRPAAADVPDTALPDVPLPQVQPVEPPGPIVATGPRRSASVEPLTGDLRRLHLTVSRRFLEKLDAARDALSHSRPGAATEEILEAALDLVLAAQAKRRGLVKEPRAGAASRAVSRAVSEVSGAVSGAASEPTGGAHPPNVDPRMLERDRRPTAREGAATRGPDAGARAASSRVPPESGIAPAAGSTDAPSVRTPAASSTSSRRGSIPAHVRREVWTRDAGRCQWPLASGGICGSTRRLELDHVEPVARGGASTAGNLRVLCGRHNLGAARITFGEAWMDRFTRRESPSNGADVGWRG